MHLDGRLRGKRSFIIRRLLQVSKWAWESSLIKPLNEFINENQNKPVFPVTSCGPISNCFDPHGHSVSTTNKIKLLCGIF